MDPRKTSNNFVEANGDPLNNRELGGKKKNRKQSLNPHLEDVLLLKTCLRADIATRVQT